jgi:polyferredoxin
MFQRRETRTGEVMKTRVHALLLISSCLLFAHPAWADDVSIDVKARKYSYTPNIIRVQKGDAVTLRLISEDVQHGLFLDGYEIETSAMPGQDGVLRFVADRSGRFSFRCSVTCGDFHPYMIGYLYVGPNAKLATGVLLIGVLGIGALLLTARREDDDPEPKLFGLIPLRWKFELTKYAVVRNLLKSRWFPFLLIVANLAIFTVILMAGLVGGFGPGNYNFGIMIVWILWWVALMLFMVPVIGRFWCMMCPFPLIGEWLQRGRLVNVGRRKPWGLAKRWPLKLRNLWPLVILFWVSTWFSGFFTVRPYATFVLLGVIIAGAIVMAVIYQRRAFCISVCPVSGFQGLYANFALCEVRAKDPEVCKQHKQKTCFTGSDKGYGCPWMELPYDMNRNTYCGLCMECFKTCPYDNMALNVRPFGANLFAERRRTDDLYGRRGTDEAFKGLTMVGIMFAFFIAMQGPFGHIKDNIRATTAPGFLQYIAESAVVDFLAIPGMFLLFAFLSRIASRSNDVKLKQVFVNFSYILVPVGLATWGAFSLGIIMPNGSYLLHAVSDPFAWGWNLFGTAQFPWTPFLTGAMPYVQMAVIVVGFLFALDIGRKFSRQTYASPEESRRGWIPIVIYLVLLHVLFMWLFLG